MQNLISVNQLVEIENEPRIRDLDLAERLGMSQPLNIRTVIAANRDELETYGSFHVASENPGKQGGRPGKAYYLTEGQALVICALSRTDKAAQVRKMLIDVFMAYRQGKVVHVKEHRRRMPRFSQIGKGTAEFAKAYEDARLFLRVTTCDRDEMLASLMARVALMENALRN